MKLWGIGEFAYSGFLNRTAVHLLRQSIVQLEWSADKALNVIREFPPSRTMDCRNKSGNDNCESLTVHLLHDGLLQQVRQ
jgi:hypothetical protein